MKLTFIYQSVKALPAALAFYRDELGLDEAWRRAEGEGRRTERPRSGPSKARQAWGVSGSRVCEAEQDQGRVASRALWRKAPALVTA
jgi:catechol 2,3-dioxygenase-like lactoylglutathione lyase family enzyme